MVTDNTPTITEEAVALLARVAGLPLDQGRLPMLASALETDLRLIAMLRHIEVSEFVPDSISPLAEARPDGR